MLPVFQTPFLTGVTVTNNQSVEVSIFGAVSLGSGETSGVIEGQDLQKLIDMFNEPNSKLLRWHNEGKISVTAVTNSESVDGADKAPAAPVSVSVTIGAPNVSGCDFNFTAANNDTAQNIDLGSLIPKHSFCLGVGVVCKESYGTNIVMSNLAAADAKHDFDNSVWDPAGEVVNLKTSADHASARGDSITVYFINEDGDFDSEAITLDGTNSSVVVSGSKLCTKLLAVTSTAISVVSLIAQNGDADPCVTIATPSATTYGSLTPDVSTASGTNFVKVTSSVAITGSIVVIGTNASDASINQVLVFNAETEKTSTIAFKTVTALYIGDDNLAYSAVNYSIERTSGVTARDLTVKVGKTSGGNEFITAAECDVADEVLSSATGAAPLVGFSSSATNVFVNGLPDSNEKWIDSTNGKWELKVLYIPV